MISVCLTTYNGEEYILEQIQSILCQIGNDDEVIISDDGSTDHTLKILNKQEDHRIKIYHNNNSKGIISNIENALTYAKGDIIFLADQDDVWLPNKVRICSEALINNNLVISDCYV